MSEAWNVKFESDMCQSESLTIVEGCHIGQSDWKLFSKESVSVVMKVIRAQHRYTHDI